MNILVTGAAGMIGRKFCEALVKRKSIGGRSVDRLTMADAIPPTAPKVAPFEIDTLSADITDPRVAGSLMRDRPEIIYHLAAIVSGEAEAEFDKGYRVNLSGTQQLFEAVRQAGHRPRVVFASSIAVYGTPFPETIPEDYALRPLTSYGTQKAIGELLLGDLSRRGFFDGIGIRFPTICVRPGKPNKAASGFFSSIIREPDSKVQRIVDGWPQRLDAARAQALGFQAETDFEEIIKSHVEDECGGDLPARPTARRA